MMRCSPLLACLCWLALVLVTGPGCRSAAPNPERQYHRVLAELKGGGGLRGLAPDGRQKMDELLLEVEAWALEGRLESPTDQMWAAACLLQGETTERVEWAQKLAVKAVLGGEERAKTILAQAMDKQALMANRPQPYGTQYVFHSNPGLWVLHPVDPKTTDAERAEVGLPPLAELEDLVRRLNEQLQEAMLENAERRMPPGGLPQ